MQYSSSRRGVTGLAAAARLAAKGHQVTIFEKNEQVGGRMSQFKKDGFTFDMGPTIVMVPMFIKPYLKKVANALKIT